MQVPHHGLRMAKVAHKYNQSAKYCKSELLFIYAWKWFYPKSYLELDNNLIHYKFCDSILHTGFNVICFITVHVYMMTYWL